MNHHRLGPMSLCDAGRVRQRISRGKGAISVFAALASVVLIGMIGLAIDTGRLLAVHSELQGAADACALSAALELNGMPDATSRARLAGQFVAAKNRSNFQTQPVAIADADVTFAKQLPPAPPAADGFMGEGSILAADARYVRCTARVASLSTTFMRVMGITAIPAQAAAIAGVAPSQSACVIPMALCSKGTGNDFGYSAGGTATLADAPTSGFFTWADVKATGSSPSIAELRAAFNQFGYCDTPTTAGRCIPVHNGEAATLQEDWNARFGVYKQNSPRLSPSTSYPDLTGYGYWPPLPSNGAASNYAVRARDRTPYQISVNNIPGYQVPANVNAQYGAPFRRLAVMPVIDCAGTCGGTTSAKAVVGWACVLLLAPKTADSKDLARIEYLSRADASNTPCRTAGIPGDSAAIGPMVPILAQ